MGCPKIEDGSSKFKKHIKKLLQVNKSPSLKRDLGRCFLRLDVSGFSNPEFVKGKVVVHMDFESTSKCPVLSLSKGSVWHLSPRCGFTS